MDQIQRNGQWWNRQADGTWLRFDVDSGQWVPSATPPPPPPPPPPADTGPYFPLAKTRSFSFAIGDLDPRLAIAAGAALLVGLLVAAFMVFGGNEPSVDLAAASVPAAAPEKKLSKKAQFIHDADAVCAHLMTVAGKMPTPTDLAELVALLRDARAEVLASYEKLKALDPPAGARKAWKRYLGSPKELQIFDRMISAAQRGDVATLQRLGAQLEEKSNKGSRWANRYGFKVCSQDF